MRAKKTFSGAGRVAKVYVMTPLEQSEGIHSKRYVAWLDAGGAMPPVRCYAENVSQSGAQLKVFRSPVPAEFTLYFSRRGDAKVRCRVVSIALPLCDVEFITASENCN